MAGKEVSSETKPQKSSEGLSIDKKTVASILCVLAAVLVFVGILTQVVPGGEYQIDADGSIIDGTYAEIPDYKLPVWKIIASPILAFTSDNAATGLGIIAILILVNIKKPDYLPTAVLEVATKSYSIYHHTMI